MNYYVYKITNTLTNEYYIGSRECECSIKDDTYYGSPVTWDLPKNKDILNKEILKDDFSNRDDAVKYEAKLIKENIKDNLNKNYYIPGHGFYKGMENKSHTKEARRKISEAVKEWHRNHNIKGDKNPFYGKKHTDEVKSIISKKNKEYYKNNDVWNKGKEMPELSELRKRWHEENDISGENHPMYGKSHRKETKRKMSNNHADFSGKNNPRARKIIVIKSDKIYDTLKEASNELDVSMVTLIKHCKDRVKNPKYRYL